VEGSEHSSPRPEDVDALLEQFDLGLLTWKELQAELALRGLKLEAEEDATGAVDDGEDARSDDS
jgi:hypothetical protein